MKHRHLLLIASCCFITNAFADHWVRPYPPGMLPTNAFIVGYENNGTPIYLCHARYQNSLQPGKTWANSNQCNIPYGGQEYQIKSDYSVYDRVVSNGRWVRGGSGNLPEGAMVVGFDTDNKNLYLCRSYLDNGLQPGKTWQGSTACNVPYNGKEYMQSDYSIFTYDGSNPTPAPQPVPQPYPHHHHHHQKQTCIQNAFGQQACGYNCAQSLQTVQCASTPDQNCVANNFGQIQCGRNCSVDDFGRFQCS